MSDPMGRRPNAPPPWWPTDEPWPPTGGWSGGGGDGWGRGSPVGPRSRWGPGRHGRWGGRQGGWGGPPRGFGCLFGVAFLLVVVAVVAALVSLVSFIGPFAAALGAVVLAAVGTLAARTVRRTAVGLDDLVDAVGRVETGDYAIRVSEPRGPRPLRALVRGFNTMAARLEADERQRRSLLADVSHELRTPLAVMQGSLEAIQDGVHPADETHLAAILDESRVLARLIDDLRTVALAEGGTLPLHREPTDLGILLTDVATAARAGATESGVTIDVAAADDLPLLDVDPVRVREVVSNLVTNALRYTPSGGSITIVATHDPAGGTVRVAVRDSGAGIPADVLPHVFDRFWKSPESRGSGLGLAIARSLVEAHGGRIGVDSVPRAGTTVWFSLPAG